KALVAQYRDFRDEVTIAASELATLRAQADRAVSTPPPQPARPVTCMACGHEPRVRACAACLASERAYAERREHDGSEQVRFAVRDRAGGTTYVSNWTPMLELEPPGEPSL